MKLSQMIAIRKSIAARKAAQVETPVAVAPVKKPRSEKQLANDKRYGEMVRARIAARKAAAEAAEPVAA